MKRFNVVEVEKVHELYLKGLSDKDIGQEVGRSPRAVFDLRKRNGWTKNVSREKDTVISISMEDMTKTQRIEHLRERFNNSPRCKQMLQILNGTELELFQDEYFKLLGEIDNITAAEEQSLFLAVFEFVLAFQAQQNRAEEEDKVKKTKLGIHKIKDPDYRLQVSERWNKEYVDHMRTYRDLIGTLKLSREQRLKDEIKTKKSFLDFAQSMNDKDVQASIATEILELNKKTDEELKRLFEKGYVFGDINANQ